MTLEFHDKKDWPWDEVEEDWDGTEDKFARNKAKEDKERRKRSEKAPYIGQCMLGIGPVKKQSFEYFNNITGNYSEGKKMAAVEFLSGYLKFDHVDMSEMDITDTKVSPKGDNIIYIVLDCPEKARNIR